MDTVSLKRLPFFKLVVGHVYFWYGMVSFILSTLLIGLICMLYRLWVSDKNRGAVFFHKLSFYWIRFLMCMLGFRFRMFIKKGAIDTSKPHIYVANHRSLLDIWLTTPLLPQPTFTIGKESFARIPFFGVIYKMGSVLVNRKDARSRAASFLALQKVLQDNLSVCIYPEGTRNKTTASLLPFQNGAFKLARQTGIPIIPVVIKGTDKALPALYPFYMSPAFLEMHLLCEVSPADFDSEAALKEHCRELMHLTYTK